VVHRVGQWTLLRSRSKEDAMRIERIDTDEIVGLRCPKTGTSILWDDEDIAVVLSGTVVLAVITSQTPEECAVEGMPLAESWKLHYASVNTSKMSLDEVVEAFPAAGKAFKVDYSGIGCGLVCDAAYYIVPDELPDECFIHADFEDDAEVDANE
jgi:hypothetical protein